MLIEHIKCIQKVTVILYNSILISSHHSLANIYSCCIPDSGKPHGFTSKEQSEGGLVDCHGFSAPYSTFVFGFSVPGMCLPAAHASYLPKYLRRICKFGRAIHDMYNTILYFVPICAQRNLPHTSISSEILLHSLQLTQVQLCSFVLQNS